VGGTSQSRGAEAGQLETSDAAPVRQQSVPSDESWLRVGSGPSRRLTRERSEGVPTVVQFPADVAERISEW